MSHEGKIMRQYAAWILLLSVFMFSGMTAQAQRSGPDNKLEAKPLDASWTFDKDAAGKVPEGWTFKQTNPSDIAPVWKVIADATAPSAPNVLALETKSAGDTFNLAIEETQQFKDFDLSMKLKAVSGSEDQGGGPIWRCKDQNNYYVCRMNPLEGNFRLYYVLNGRRKQLKSADVKAETGKWCAIRVTMTGNQITCYLDGIKLLEALDDTFKEAGKVGFWTKADAASEFDDLAVKSVEQK